MRWITDDRTPPLRAALRNRAVARVLVGWYAAAIAEWALWIGALVLANDSGGATATGLVSLGLVVPAALVAPLAGSSASGRRPNRVLAIVFGMQAACLGVAALLAHLHAPLGACLVPLAGATTLVTFLRPTYATVMPGLVTSASQLTATNVLVGYIENSSVLMGPLLAGALLVARGPSLVLAACAALVAMSMVATFPLRALDPPADAADQRPRRTHARWRTLLDDARRLAHRDGAGVLLLVLGGQYVLIGGLDLLYVVLAADVLHLSASGPGLLSASFGLGSIIGGAASTLLVARRRLAPLIAAGLFAVTVALIALAGHPALSIALVALPLMGVSRAIIDVTGRMLLQRSAPDDAIASIFATLEALALAGTALGSVVVQVLVATVGARGAMFGLGGVIALLGVAAMWRLMGIDAIADVPVVAIRLLRRTSIFGSLPLPALEAVARAAVAESVASGSTIVRTGDPGSRYYEIAGGTVDVFVGGVLTRSLGRGDGFGEIALLVDVARTATVVATSDVELLSIERTSFLTAVTGHDASRSAAWGAARSYADTKDLPSPLDG